MALTPVLAPDKQAVEDALLARELSETDEPGMVKFIVNGLKIQIEQYVSICSQLTVILYHLDFRGKPSKRLIHL